jgi:hypothetical protein
MKKIIRLSESDLIELINEVKIRKKEKLGMGTEHDIYPSETNPDVVMKVRNCVPEKEVPWVETFKKNPDIFPIVIKHTKNYVCLEKLDTNKAVEEFEDMENFLGYELTEAYWEGIVRNKNTAHLKILDDKFMESELYEIYSRWKDLILRFYEIIPPNFYPDLHGEQFGYSKDGKLKILDY